MKIFLFFTLLLTSTFAYEMEGSFILLTNDTFQQAVDEFEFLVVDFCANWIQLCNDFNKVYKEVQKEINEDNPEVKFAKIDSVKEYEIREKYGAQRYPSLFLFVRGNDAPFVYDDERKLDDFIRWIRPRTGEPSQVSNSLIEVNDVIKHNDVVAIFFKDESSPAHDEVIKVAKIFRELPFIHTSNEEVKKHFGIEKETLSIFKHFDEGRADFTGPFNFDDIKKWAFDHKVPLVVPYHHKNAKNFAPSGVTMIAYIRPKVEERSQAELEFRKFAHEIKGQYFITLAEYGEKLATDLSHRLGFNEADLPVVLIQETRGRMRKYLLEGDITENNLRKFVYGHAQKELEHYKITEPIPANSYEDGVRILVGKNFEEGVFENDKNILVDFVVADCFECDEFKPVFADLAKHLEDVEDLVLARIDVGKNELEDVGLSGFPTLRLYPKEDKEQHVDFKGDKTRDNVVDFLKKHSKLNLRNKGRNVDIEL